VTYVKEKEWLTLKEASELTGKSLNAIRLLVHRKKIDKVKKVHDKKATYWLIHKDTLLQTYVDETASEKDISPGHTSDVCQDDKTIHIDAVIEDDNTMSDISLGHMSDMPHAVIPFEVYDRKQKEWTEERDHLQAGMLMYRWKFEELDKQIKILPAPPEFVVKELEDKSQALVQAEKILEEAKETQKTYIEEMNKLRAKLHEEEYAKEAFRLQWEIAQAEAQRPWWQKIWRKR